jgi:hypothetical protein
MKPFDLMLQQLIKLAVLPLAIAFIAFAAWTTPGSIRSDLSYRASEAQYACLDKHPISKLSSGREVDAANACFKLTGPPPNAWFWVRRSEPMISSTVWLVAVLALFRRRKPKGSGDVKGAGPLVR